MRIPHALQFISLLKYTKQGTKVCLHHTSHPFMIGMAIQTILQSISHGLANSKQQKPTVPSPPITHSKSKALSRMLALGQISLK